MDSQTKIKKNIFLFLRSTERELTLVVIMIMISIAIAINNYFSTPDDVLSKGSIDISEKYGISNVVVYSGDGTIVEEVNSNKIQYAYAKLEGEEYSRISTDEVQADINDYTAIMISTKINDAAIYKDTNSSDYQKIVISTISGTPIATYEGKNIICNTNKISGATLVTIDGINYVLVNANVSVFQKGVSQYESTKKW